MITHITDSKQKAAIAASILHALPEWFGIPESTENYISESKDLPFFSCMAPKENTANNRTSNEETTADDSDNDTPIGFITLKETSPHTAEIHVCSVLKEYHRTGIGTALFHKAETYAKEHGYYFLQVKTVKKGYYREYDITNAFYERMGFKELECFPTLWDEANPCQIYVKSLT